MKTYKVSLNGSESQLSSKSWNHLKDLYDFMSERIASNSIEIFATTYETDNPYQVAFIVEDDQVSAFEALIPEAIRVFQQAHKGCSIVFQEMVEAPAPPPFVYAEKTEGGWTVDGMEMVDILSPD